MDPVLDRGISALWTTVARELGRAAHRRQSTSPKHIASATLDATALDMRPQAVVEGSYCMTLMPFGAFWELVQRADFAKVSSCTSDPSPRVPTCSPSQQSSELSTECSTQFTNVATAMFSGRFPLGFLMVIQCYTTHVNNIYCTYCTVQSVCDARLRPVRELPHQSVSHRRRAECVDVCLASFSW